MYLGNVAGSRIPPPETIRLWECRSPWRPIPASFRAHPARGLCQRPPSKTRRGLPNRLDFGVPVEATGSGRPRRGSRIAERGAADRPRCDKRSRLRNPPWLCFGVRFQCRLARHAIDQTRITGVTAQRRTTFPTRVRPTPPDSTALWRAQTSPSANRLADAFGTAKSATTIMASVR